MIEAQGNWHYGQGNSSDKANTKKVYVLKHCDNQEFELRRRESRGELSALEEFQFDGFPPEKVKAYA